MHTEPVLHIDNARRKPQKMCVTLQEDTPSFGRAHAVHRDRESQIERGGGCSVSNHDVDCKVWTALDVHFEVVVKCQGDLTLKPVCREHVVQDESDVKSTPNSRRSSDSDILAHMSTSCPE